MGKWCLQASSFIFDWIFVKLAGNQDRHKNLGRVRILARSDQSLQSYVPWGRIKFSIDILWNLQVQFTFQTLEFFVTLLSGTVRPRRLKLGAYVGSGKMYHVYQNQAAATYSSLYFFIFLSLQFSTLKVFVTLFSGTVRPRRLKLGTYVGSGQMYHVNWNQAAAAYSSLYFFIFLSLQFSTLKFFVTRLLGTVRPRRLKLSTHIDWADVSFVLESNFMFSIIVVGERLHKVLGQIDLGTLDSGDWELPFGLLVSFSNVQTLKIFVTLFSGTVRPRRLKLGAHVDIGWMYRVYRNQAVAAYLSLYFFIFLSNFQTLKCFCHTFLRNCEA